MTNNPNQPHIDIPAPEIHGRMLPPQAILALGVVATIAASGAANYFNGEDGRPKIPAIDVEWGTESHAAGTIDDGITVTGKDGDIVSVLDGRTEVGTSMTQEKKAQGLSDVLDEEWARQFAQDVEAGKLLNPAEIDVFAEKVKAETSNGWAIEKISVLGTTSAEDDTTDSQGIRTAGLQETDDSVAVKQEELGNRRRNIGTIQLAAALQERGVAIDASMIDALPSIENVLTDEEVAQVDGLAQQFGYDSTTRMIEKWNRDPDSSPPAVDKILTEILAKERTFQVKISMNKTETHETPSVDDTDNQGADEQPGSDTKAENVKVVDEQSNHEDHKLRLLPIIIPGYLFITMGRTRMRVPGNLPKVSQSAGAGPLPRIPDIFVPVADGSGSTVVKTPTEKPPTSPPNPPAPWDRFVKPRDVPMPKSRIDQAAYHRKQPRNHNFSQNSGRMAGGSGRMSRSSGGSRSGKRSSR